MTKTEVLEKIDETIKINERVREWIKKLELKPELIFNYHEWGLLEITAKTKKDFILCRKELERHFSILSPYVYAINEKEVKLEISGRDDTIIVWLNIKLPLEELPKEYKSENCYIRKVEEKKENYYYECKLGG